MTTTDDDRGEIGRLRAAFTVPAGPPPAPEDCPPAETIWAAVRGELPPDELRTVVDHTAVCAACAEDWRLAAAFEEEARAPAAVPAVGAIPHRSRFRRLAPLTAAAAAVLLLVLARGPLEDLGREEKPTYRGGETALVSLLEQGELLPRTACLLEWSGLPGATYDVEVRLPAGRTVAAARGLAEPEYLVPEKTLSGIPPGTHLEWQVAATLPDGGRLRSELLTFFLE